MLMVMPHDHGLSVSSGGRRKRMRENRSGPQLGTQCSGFTNRLLAWKSEGQFYSHVCEQHSPEP